MAAEKGSPNGMYNLYWMLRWGLGCKKNVDEAVDWLLKAADLGHYEAKKEIEDNKALADCLIA